jgi:hypothetical protein
MGRQNRCKIYLSAFDNKEEQENNKPLINKNDPYKDQIVKK